MARNIFYGIKFPFTSNNEDGTFVDLNANAQERTASEILHVILTPKGTRIRRPDFGTNLMRYVFGQNDEITWSDVRLEIDDNISKFVRGVSIDDVEIVRDEENDNGIYVVVAYTVTQGNKQTQYKIGTKI